MKNHSNEKDCLCQSNHNCECKCAFLTPLCIDSLFKQNLNNNICDVLDKTKKVRNSYFTAIVSIKNFIDACAAILDEIQSFDEYGETESQHIKQSYLHAVNILLSSLFSALSVSYKDDKIFNNAYSKVDSVEYKRTPECSDLVFQKYEEPCSDTVLLTKLPGFLLQYNKLNKQIKLTLRESDYYHPEINMSSLKTNRSSFKTNLSSFIIAPSILTGADLSMDLSENDNSFDIFDNYDLVRDFMEEIINYTDIDNDDDLTFGNQIMELTSYLDNLTKNIENIHKYIVQVCKIENN